MAVAAEPTYAVARNQSIDLTPQAWKDMNTEIARSATLNTFIATLIKC
jgi:hypothetical protein